jgi:hypothetical protein
LSQPAALLAEGSQSSASSGGGGGSAPPMSVSTSGTQEEKNMSTANSSQQTTADSGVASSQTTALILTVGLVVITIGGLSIGLTVTMAGNHTQMTAFERYLQQHRHAVQEGLALGAGASMQDLADAFDIPVPLHPRFGVVMRRHASPLLAMLATDQPITAPQAARFVDHTLRTIISDPTLGPVMLARASIAITATLDLPDAYYLE